MTVAEQGPASSDVSIAEARALAQRDRSTPRRSVLRISQRRALRFGHQTNARGTHDARCGRPPPADRQHRTTQREVGGPVVLCATGEVDRDVRRPPPLDGACGRDERPPGLDGPDRCTSFARQQLHESGYLNDAQQRGRRVDDSKCQARLRHHGVSRAQQCS